MFYHNNHKDYNQKLINKNYQKKVDRNQKVKLKCLQVLIKKANKKAWDKPLFLRKSKWKKFQGRSRLRRKIYMKLMNKMKWKIKS